MPYQEEATSDFRKFDPFFAVLTQLCTHVSQLPAEQNRSVLYTCVTSGCVRGLVDLHVMNLCHICVFESVCGSLV